MKQQWIVLLTSHEGEVRIANFEGCQLASTIKRFDNEVDAENFASVCRGQIDGLYSAQVVDVSYGETP